MLKAEIKTEFQVRTPLPFPLDVLLNEKPVGKPTTQKLLAAHLFARMLELQYLLFFFLHGAAVRQKLLQCPVNSDNEGRVNAQWKMNTFSSKSIHLLSRNL